MATGTFTYNALRTKTLNKRIKKTKKNCKSFKLDESNAVSVGTTAMKPHLSKCLVGLVWFARHFGKMYSRHLFSYGGLLWFQFYYSLRLAKLVWFWSYDTQLKIALSLHLMFYI